MDPDFIMKESMMSSSSSIGKGTQDNTFGGNDPDRTDDSFSANDRTGNSFSANDRTDDDSFSANDRSMSLTNEMHKKLSLEPQASGNYDDDKTYNFEKFGQSLGRRKTIKQINYQEMVEDDTEEEFDRDDSECDTNHVVEESGEKINLELKYGNYFNAE